ncbi:hypothetical protein J27TS8_34290 [Robertmurraya siralis]|uniref:DUF4173 domain-containing protein n=1 Tax=Robertmurraya siralis TaxID=77777 RepID=A0A919WKL5_9BACI|nr:DUF4173 domain-containing protein [Robertmurraya siralis]GIN63436.1 hypothetical protein J27TS8_34290 [Robertmurraya siralis]
MESMMKKVDWLFLILCLAVGVVAEEAFFREKIGISYLLFIMIFYAVFYWRFRTVVFTHQRFGYFVLMAIWLLAASYYLYDVLLFQFLNIVLIPALVMLHLVLITSPKKVDWTNLMFIVYIGKRLINGLRYNFQFANHLATYFKKGSESASHEIGKKIIIGIIIAVPVLFIVLNLLISADAYFEQMMNSLPQLLNFRTDYLFRFLIICIFGFGIFGFLQALSVKNIQAEQKERLVQTVSFDGIITITVLALLNVVYVVFIIIQFKYFFSETLVDGYTYAEYARRGFFELLFVTLINLSMTTVVITSTKQLRGVIEKLVNISLSLLVLCSGIMLVSAYMRLMMYEEAYGFTITRVLAHSFMIFLMVIFAYTFVKIWLKRLSLFHFYFIAALVYYVGINLIHIDRIIVAQNIERYETTGKIDIDYLGYMSATGIIGLIELYEQDPEIPGLKELLAQKKDELPFIKSDSWQSTNYTRDKAYQKLEKLNL